MSDERPAARGAAERPPSGRLPAAQPEDLWVIVDGTGHPCLEWMMRLRHSEGNPPPLPEDGLDPDFGPYRYARYRLVPGWQP